MHIQKSHAAVNDIHSIICSDIGNRSAASLVHFAQFRGLPADAGAVHNPPQLSDILCAGVIGTGFSSGTGVLIKHHAASQVRRVLLFKSGRIVRVKSRAHIRRKHVRILQAPAQRQFGILAGQLHHFRRHIFKIPGLHARGSHAADLLLVSQQTHGSIRRILYFQLSQKGRERADPIVLAISHDHAPVQSKVPGRSCRYRLQFRREEVFLFNSILLLQDPEQRFPDLFFLLCILQRTAAHDHIQVFTFHHDGCFLLQLLRRKVDQQIRDAEHRIPRLLTDRYLHRAPVFFHHCAVQGKRDRRPLVFFDAAIIMGLQKRHLSIFI